MSITEVPVVSAAFQGELGAFSSTAAEKLLGSNVRYLPCRAFQDVFDALAEGQVDFSVIPIENTLYGSVHENYDHLLRYNFEIGGETTLRIEHSLIALPGVPLADIKQAYSHPVALDQCRRFFQSHPDIKPVPYYDTAGSVKMIMTEKPPHSAAIASARAASLYNAEVVLHGIEDNQTNFTRFFLLTKQQRIGGIVSQESETWKTALAFTTLNMPGALVKALNCFSIRNLNLSKLESRPLRESPWEYLFYLDIAGSAENSEVRDAIEDLRKLTSSVRILGSFCPIL